VLHGALVCRVITHASHQSVRDAFIARGVPAADIIQISAKAIGDTGVLSNTVFIRLKPCLGRYLCRSQAFASPLVGLPSKVTKVVWSAVTFTANLLVSAQERTCAVVARSLLLR